MSMSLTGLGPAVTFQENAVNAAPALLDGSVVFASVGPLAAGASLTVTGLLPEDVVGIRNAGAGAGQIDTSGNQVRFGGVAFADFTGGNGTTLTVNLFQNTTAAQVDALIEALTYANASNTPTALRLLAITVQDTKLGTAAGNIDVAVLLQDDAPVFLSGTSASVVENLGGTAYTAVAVDPEGTPVFYSLQGADAALFTISATTGVVSFMDPPDFEAPKDAGADNVYDITVVATSNLATTNRNVAITVTDANDPNLLEGFGPARIFTEGAVNAAPQLLDNAVRFVAGNPPYGGLLSVGGLLPEDRVGLQNQGSGPGQIGVQGDAVSFGGVVIGTVSGGIGSRLDVALNGSVTPAAMDALIQALTYANVSDTPTRDRNLTLEYVNEAGLPMNAPTVGAFVTLPGVQISANVTREIKASEGLLIFTTVDLDGDGLRDLVAGRLLLVDPEPLSWFRGLGGADFAPRDATGNPFAGLPGADFLNSPAPAFLDLDGDGDLDLVLGDRTGLLQAWLASDSGYAVLAGGANPFADIDVGFNSVPAALDVNGDGRTDLVVGSSSGGLRVWHNTSGGFIEQTGAANPFNGMVFGLRTSPTVGHLDGDGRPDLVVGFNGGLAGLRNMPDGFLLLEGTMNPFSGLTVPSGFLHPVLLDLDRDGLDDIFYSSRTAVNTTPLALLPVTVLAEDDTPRGPRVVTLAASAEDATRVITQAELLAGWSDPEGAALQALDLAVISDPAGTLVDNGNGTWSFTPALNDNSNVVFAFDVTDGVNNVGAVARMDLTPVNDAPTGIVNLLLNGASNVITTSAELKDVDGLGDITFRWQAFTGGAWQDIAGANGSGFVPGAALHGTLIRSVARYTDGDGTVENVPSLFVARVGGAANDSFANPAIPSLQTGGAGNDSIAGSNQRDVLFGGAGDDSLVGNNGNDILIGGLGADTMTGGVGIDSFRYVQPAEAGDVITDFLPGTDVIQVDASFFRGLAVGRLDAANFAAGAPTAALPQLLYAGGALYFDADGTGPAAAVLLATLLGAPALGASDIFVIP